MVVSWESLVFPALWTFKTFHSSSMPFKIISCWLHRSGGYCLNTTICTNWFVQPTEKRTWKQRLISFYNHVTLCSSRKIFIPILFQSVFRSLHWGHSLQIELSSPKNSTLLRHVWFWLQIWGGSKILRRGIWDDCQGGTL